MKDLQKKVLVFVEKYNLTHSPEISAIDLVSEIGEVAKEILKSTNYGTKPFKKTKGMKSELGDLLYSLIALANAMDVDLEDALNTVLAKYEKRLKNTESVQVVENRLELPTKPSAKSWFSGLVWALYLVLHFLLTTYHLSLI